MLPPCHLRIASVCHTRAPDVSQASGGGPSHLGVHLYAVMIGGSNAFLRRKSTTCLRRRNLQTSQLPLLLLQVSTSREQERELEQSGYKVVDANVNAGTMGPPIHVW